MKLIRTVDAAGQVLCHDITQIIPGEFKGARFKKGHIIQPEDIPVLLSIGKENLYVWEKKPGILHEDEAAALLYKAAAGQNIHGTEPREGKIELIADCDPDCRCDLCDHLCILICKKIPDHFDIGIDTDRTCRTDNPALSTVYAVCLCNLFVKCRCYQSLCSPVCKINRINRLYIVAHTDTVTTENTFIRVTHD